MDVCRANQTPVTQSEMIKINRVYRAVCCLLLFRRDANREVFNNLILILHFEVILVLGYSALFYPTFRLQTLGDQSFAFSSDFHAINPKTCVHSDLFLA